MIVDRHLPGRLAATSARPGFGWHRYRQKTGRKGVDAAFMLFERTARWRCWQREAARRGTGSASAAVARLSHCSTSPVWGFYGVDAAFML
jgi:hypothetical protein